MIALPFLAVGILMKLVAAVFFLCAVGLVLIVLIQKGRGVGLTGALGGGAASGILGSKTGDFLTWVTIVLAGLFLTLAVVMAKFYKPSASEYGATQSQQATVPAQPQQAPMQPPLVPIESGETDESAEVNSIGE